MPAFSALSGIAQNRLSRWLAVTTCHADRALVFTDGGSARPVCAGDRCWRWLYAALLAHLTGPNGHVTAIDVDVDIVDQARKRLAAAGVSNVEVVLGDGALGYLAGAPFDRIVATVDSLAGRSCWFPPDW